MPTCGRPIFGNAVSENWFFNEEAFSDSTLYCDAIGFPRPGSPGSSFRFISKSCEPLRLSLTLSRCAYMWCAHVALLCWLNSNLTEGRVSELWFPKLGFLTRKPLAKPSDSSGGDLRNCGMRHTANTHSEHPQRSGLDSCKLC